MTSSSKQDSAPQLTTIDGLRTKRCETFADHRGRFVEVDHIVTGDHDDQCWRVGPTVETNVSYSKAGVLRGLHGDDRTWKRLQCLWGRIFLVVADLRPNSSTYLAWQAWNLCHHESLQILVPPGCVNGHYALDDSALLYLQTEKYLGAEAQISVRWNDPALAIDWPTTQPVVSQRDGSTPYLDLSRGQPDPQP